MTFFFLLFFLCFPIHGQNANGGQAAAPDEAVPLRKETEWHKLPSIPYRPGLNYKNSSLEPGHGPNRISSPSLSAESPSPGRMGSVRLDGAGTKPLFSVDGFISKDVSINEGQILLDMLPIDFAESVDIYKQNLYPIGVPTGSLIDFRLGRGEKYTSLLSRAGTIGNWYLKLQGEELFEGGSTLYGAAADFLFKDYYYASPDGFKNWAGSTYQRAAVLSKTIYKDWQFFVSDVFLRSFDEDAIGVLTRNNLIAGLRWQRGLGRFQASYNFTSLEAAYPTGATNQYLGHYFTLTGGASARSGRFRWNVAGGYTHSSVADAPWAPNKNYLSAPAAGDNSFNLVLEGGVSVHKEADNSPVNAEFAVAINQIASTLYGYTPIPSFTLDVRHRNGLYFSADVSRVYITPDFTTQFGFGLAPGAPFRHLAPKDGLRTGVEIGWSAPTGRIYLQSGFSWFETGFRIVNNSNVINVSKVFGFNAELGGDLKIPTGPSALTEISAGLAFNDEADGRGTRTPLLPMIKFVSSLGWRGIGEDWGLKFIYTLHWNISSGTDIADLTPRHFLDLTARWRWFSFSLLNILNTAYRPDPFNTLSAYNPGIRAEFGVKYEWK